MAVDHDEAHAGRGDGVTGGEPREIGMSIALPGSPLAAFQDRLVAELASDSIPCACPHPATASRLFLPARVLCCEDCEEGLRDAADEQPPRCAICTGAATRMTVWMTGPVLVMTRLCDACSSIGNTPVSRN
jgi:hypothetical protein